MHDRQSQEKISCENAHTAEGRGCTFPSGTHRRGEENQDGKTNLTRFFVFFNSYRESGENGFITQRRTQIFCDRDKHGTDDISAEKDSDETVTMAEKESDKTVTMSRADTVGRTEERGGNDVQL